MEISKIKKGKEVYIYYTIFFAAAAALCFSFFAIQGKSFVWKNDGLYEHYNAFLYFGKWVREIIRGVISDHNFVIPMWEWGLGAGADAIGNQLFYDPFFLLSVFIPTEFAEFGYNFSVILRLYLSGFVFCVYCRKMDCIKWTTVCAAIMYVFCAYTFFAAPRHPYFVNAMIYLPLVFIGCEKILKNESFVTFSLGVALAAISDFYFFYMIAILTVLYVGVRVLIVQEHRQFKFIFKKVGEFFVCAILGVAISCVLFLPTSMSFLENNTRISSTYTFNAFYSLSQYSALPGSFVSATDYASNWGIVGLSPLIYIGVIGSFVNCEKKERWARVFVLAEIVFLSFPIFGHIFNGFGYVTNRWVFAWPFIPAYLFAKEFPGILQFSTKKKGLLALGCVAYTILCVILEKSRNEVNIIGIVFLLLSLILAMFVPNINAFRVLNHEVSTNRISQLFSVVLIFVSIFHMSYYRYSEKEDDYLREYRDENTVNSLLTDELASVWSLINDEEFYRVDSSIHDHFQANYPLFSHQPTTVSYWSLNSKEYIEWRETNSAYDFNNFRFRGLSSRAWLEPQYCAKYFTVSNNKNARASVPYGYEYQGKVEGFSSEYFLYKTENTLPFGSTYDCVISRSDFERLSIVERQQASLQNCVIDDDIKTDLSNDIPQFDDFEIDYQLECGKNVTSDGNMIHVKSNDGIVTLNFDGNTDGELYVLLSSLKFQNGSSSTKIAASCNGVSYFAEHFSEYNIYSEGRTEYLLNLGYSDEKRNQITIRFSDKGDYTFDALSVICQPMDRLSEYIEARNKDALENVEFSINKISGTIDLEKAKLLCLSLPYSKGWTAYVDGEKVELIHANIAFSGIMLEPGHHEIQLSFCTPYLKIGVVISVLGLICLVISGILFKHRDSISGKLFKKHEK